MLPDRARAAWRLDRCRRRPALAAAIPTSLPRQRSCRRTKATSPDGRAPRQAQVQGGVTRALLWPAGHAPNQLLPKFLPCPRPRKRALPSPRSARWQGIWCALVGRQGSVLTGNVRPVGHPWRTRRARRASYAASVAGSIDSTMEGSSFSGLLTLGRDRPHPHQVGRERPHEVTRVETSPTAKWTDDGASDGSPSRSIAAADYTCSIAVADTFLGILRDSSLERRVRQKKNEHRQVLQERLAHVPSAG